MRKTVNWVFRGLLVVLGATTLIDIVAVRAASFQTPTPNATVASDHSASRSHTHIGYLKFQRTNTEDILLAPQVATAVKTAIGGTVARTLVRQSFINPSNRWIEGTYVFPLPDNAAVDTLKLKVGQREIVGVIKRRESASQEFEIARTEGKQAALLESERPNVFVASVANIPPGSNVDVSFEYQQSLRYEDGKFSIRFPMVVAPRYNGKKAKTAKLAPKIGPVTIRRSPEGDGNIPVIIDDIVKVNPVTLEIILTPGFPIGELKSRYHEINVQPLQKEGYRISLKNKVVPADRDFELTWQPENGYEPTVQLLTEKKGEHHYAMAFLMPPGLEESYKPSPRELVFVIDTSGSMDGASLEQAKRALKYSIDRLGPKDKFNVIKFQSYANALFRFSRNANLENKTLAAEAIAFLQAGGGTEMAPAIQMALSALTNLDHVRQVVFITDGAVGNERELFKLINKWIGASRLYTVGIGSAPNSYFMSKSAEVGRGTYTYIGKISEVQERMETLFRNIESPMLTDIEIEWPGQVIGGGSTKFLRDLHAGEPVTTSVKLSEIDGKVVVSGCLDNRPWRRSIAMSLSHNVDGVSKIWGKSRIDELLTRAMRFSDSETAIRERISVAQKAATVIALEHGLVTRFTSLIAVDELRKRPEDEVSLHQQVPLNLPHTWKAGSLIMPAASRVQHSAYKKLSRSRVAASNPHFPDELVNRCPEMEIML